MKGIFKAGFVCAGDLPTPNPTIKVTRNRSNSSALICVNLPSSAVKKREFLEPQMTRDSRRFTQIKRREIGIIPMLTDLRLFTYRVQASQRSNKLPTPNATLKVTRNRSNSSALICVYLPSSAVKRREFI